jgi:hypothetical protein
MGERRGFSAQKSWGTFLRALLFLIFCDIMGKTERVDSVKVYFERPEINMFHA